MKNFIKIFILLEVLLFAYIFNSSIYNIFEKNNIAAEGLAGYAFEEVNPDILEKFYTIITEEYPENRFEVINNTLTSTDNSVYSLYCYPLDKFSQKQPVSKTMKFEYHELTKEDFLDSVGVFYTDISAEELEKTAERVPVNITIFVNDAIPYSMVFELNILNFLILFVVIQIIYCIYTSYSLKKIGIKKSMGFSAFRILKELIINIIRYFFIVYAAFFVLQNLFYLVNQRFAISYLLLNILFFMIVLAINILCILATSILIRFVDLEAMIKNKTLNRTTNMIVQIIKISFSVVIAFTVILLLKQSIQYSQSQQAVLDYKYLDGYYTANGFNSAEYEYALNNADVLKGYSDSMIQLYENSQSFLCDISALNMSRSSMASSRPYYETHLIIANKNYIDKFSDIKVGGNRLNIETLDQRTVLLPKKYKIDEAVIREYMKRQYDRLYHYNQFFGLEESVKEVTDFELIYTENDSTIKANTEKGFADVTGNIIILDKGDFAGLYYLDSLNTRSIFFLMDSREQFSSLLTEFDLSNLVTAGTMLTPYLMELENVTFVLKTILMFTIVFVTSLIFILYISNYVDIFVNRKRYALKEIMGFSHVRILKTRFIIWVTELLISGVLSIINYVFLCLFLIILLDYIFCELLYTSYIRKALYEIEKGA